MEFDIREWLSVRTEVTVVNRENISIPCPACTEDRGRGHFQIHVRKPVAHCFRCGYKTTWAGLVARLDNLPFDEALRVVGESRIVPLNIQKKERLKEIELPKGLGWTRGARNYLQNRGITEESIEHYNLNFFRTGFLSERIFLPITLSNKFISYQARSINGKQPKYWSAPGSEIKRLLYGYDDHDGDLAVLVEGPFDVIRLYQAGYPALGTFGKSTSVDQIELMEKKKIKDIILWYDPDAVDDTYKMWDLLSRRFNVGLIPWFDSDPAECQDYETAFDSLVLTWDGYEEKLWEEAKKVLDKGLGM